MIKQEVTYVDYNGNKTVEDLYFNLTKAELIELDALMEGGMEGELLRIINSDNNLLILETFKQIIAKAYGRKSEDGRRFIKDEAETKAFLSSEAYSALIMLFFEDADAASNFFKNVMPKDLSVKVDERFSDMTPEQIRDSYLKKGPDLLR